MDNLNKRFEIMYNLDIKVILSSINLSSIGALERYMQAMQFATRKFGGMNYVSGDGSLNKGMFPHLSTRNVSLDLSKNLCELIAMETVAEEGVGQLNIQPSIVYGDGTSGKLGVVDSRIVVVDDYEAYIKMMDLNK